MASQRVQRVQNLLRAEISTVLQRKLKDPRVTMVTISYVEAAPDLHEARVFVSVYGDRETQEVALEGLRSAAGFIRAELMKVLHLRPMPHLDFRTDESLARGAHTLDLLEQLEHEQEGREGSAGSSHRADSE
jgi:ribosome-binding factor A